MQIGSLSQKDPLEEGILPLQYSCLENLMDREAYQASVQSYKESDMAEATEAHAYRHPTG